MNSKLQQLGSSPTRAISERTLSSTERVFTEQYLKERTLTLIQEKRTEELLLKVTKRKSDTKFGPFTGADAAAKFGGGKSRSYHPSPILTISIRYGRGRPNANSATSVNNTGSFLRPSGKNTRQWAW
jgi:hypothetical protein